MRDLWRKISGIRKKRAVSVQQALSEDHACYVLITCGRPAKDGKMQVEMTYQGDPTLAAYLVESAHNLIESDAS